MSKPSSNIPNIAKAGGIMMISLFLSRVLGIVRETIIAGKFGQSDLTDAYVLSFQIPDLLFFLVAGGALSSAFIPVFTEYLHTKDEDEAWYLFSSVATIMALAVTAFVVLAFIFAPQLAVLIAPEKSAEMQGLIAYMSQIVLPAQFAFFIGGLLFGTLYARQIFSVPGLGPNIYNIGIMFGAVVVSAFVTPTVAGMSWGALGGAFLGNILLPMWAMRRMGSKYRFIIDTKHEGVRRVFKLMLPVVLGLSLPAVFSMVMQYFGGYYQEDGVNTALNTSNRLMQAPLGVFGQAMAIGAFPALSQFFATGAMDMYREQLAKTLRVVVYMSLPIAALMILAPHDIVRFFFQHGVFTPEDTHRTALALQMFALGVPAWCMHPVLMRGYFAIQRPSIPIVFGTLTTVVFVALGASVLMSEGAYYLLPLAGSIAAYVLAILMLIRIRTDVDGMDIGGIVSTFTKAGIASLIAAAAFVGVMYGVGQSGFDTIKPLYLVTVVIVGLAAMWLYYYLTKAFKMPETSYLERAVKRGRNASPTPADKPSSDSEPSEDER